MKPSIIKGESLKGKYAQKLLTRVGTRVLRWNRPQQPTGAYITTGLGALSKVQQYTDSSIHCYSYSLVTFYKSEGKIMYYAYITIGTQRDCSIINH